MKFYTIIILMCCALSLNAQPRLPRKVSAKLPALLSGKETPSVAQLRKAFRNGSNWGQGIKAKNALWVVYSDRSNNTTYTDPKMTTPLTELRFGEKVCIADIKGDMALVYADAKEHYPEIPSGIKAKGWIPMENLLLWQKCPKDREGVQRKVITAINLDWLAQDGKIHSRRYNSPSDTTKSEDMSEELKCLFVMKETSDGEYALLATSSVMNSPQSIYGWVSRNSFTDFSQRLFLEPEWDETFVEAHLDESACIYEDEGMLSVVTHWRYGRTDSVKAQQYKYRIAPHRLRYPLLGTPDANGMARCRCFGSPERFNVNFLKERIGNDYYNFVWQIGNRACAFEGYVRMGAGWRIVVLLSQDEAKELGVQPEEDFRMDIGGMYYYWIPQEYLP